MRLTTARIIAEMLMGKHGLTAQGWTFGFDHARRRFGACYQGKKRITMSKRLVMINEAERVARTILHEIAHALTPNQGHNRAWRMKCIEIGLTNPKRCFTTENTETVKPPYVAVCPGCRQEHRSFRPGRRTKSCGRCAPWGYDERFKLVWRKEVHVR